MAFAPVIVSNTDLVALANLGSNMYALNLNGGLLVWTGSAWNQIVGNLGSPGSPILFVHNGSLHISYFASDSGWWYQYLLRWNGGGGWVTVVTAIFLGSTPSSSPVPEAFASIGSVLYGAFSDGSLRHVSATSWVTDATVPGGEFRYCFNVGGTIYCGTVNQALYRFSAGTLNLVAPAISSPVTDEHVPERMEAIGGQIYAGANHPSSPLLSVWDGVSAWTALIPASSPKRTFLIFEFDSVLYFTARANGQPMGIFEYQSPGVSVLQGNLPDSGGGNNQQGLQFALYSENGYLGSSQAGSDGRLCLLAPVLPTSSAILPSSTGKIARARILRGARTEQMARLKHEYSRFYEI